MSKLYDTYVKLKEEIFKTGKFFYFTLMERGKLRNIKSVIIDERVVQRCFCDYCLVPVLKQFFIFDNSACVKGKGVHFAQKRMKYFLEQGFKTYHTNEFYVLQYDFHHYFDTISHNKLLSSVCELLKDEKLTTLYTKLVTDFGGENGLGLGSQISQISALFYPKDLDHHFKQKSELLSYCRYMDDGAMISNDKNVLNECKQELIHFVQDNLKLELNINKTHIKKVSGGFEFLKLRYFLTKTGKVIMKPNRKNITRNRKKLKKLFNNNLDFKEIKDFVKIIIGNLSHYDSYHTCSNFLNYFKKLKKEFFYEIHSLQKI